MIDQPSHIMNNKSLSIDFTTNNNLLSEAGATQTFYDKCHHNVIRWSLNLTHLFLYFIIEKSEVTKI